MVLPPSEYRKTYYNIFLYLPVGSTIALSDNGKQSFNLILDPDRDWITIKNESPLSWAKSNLR